MGTGTYLFLAAAGVVGGFVNGVAGAGSLVTFPALLGAHLGALPANVTNTMIGVPGYAGNSVGYRRELEGQIGRVKVYGAATVVGAGGGSAALLTLPGSVFREVVPYLIFLSALLMLAQPRVATMVGRSRSKADGRSLAGPGVARDQLPPRRSVATVALMALCGAYAGYFGAGVSIMLVAILAMMLEDSLQRLNALRTVLTLFPNLLAAAVFALMAPVNWSVVAVMAPASLLGGYIGALVARRIPEVILRWAIVLFAAAVGSYLIS